MTPQFHSVPMSTQQKIATLLSGSSHPGLNSLLMNANPRQSSNQQYGQMQHAVSDEDHSAAGHREMDPLTDDAALYDTPQEPQGYQGYDGTTRSLAPPNDSQAHIANLLINEGSSTAPVNHWLQGAARLAQGWAGRRMLNQHQEEMDAYQQNRTKMLENAVSDPKMNIAQALLMAAPEDRDLIGQVYDWNRNEARYQDDRSDRAADVAYRDGRAARSDLEADRSYDFNVNRANRSDFESDRTHHYRSNRDAVSDAQWRAGHDLSVAGHNLQVSKHNQEGASGGWRSATPDEIAGYGLDPQTTTAQIGPRNEFKVIREQKPLISSENMARVASNLPNLKAASQNLDELFTTRQGGGLTGAFASEKGYRPGHDWGAQLISGIPDFGMLEGLAKSVGGKDYQTYQTEYAAFEAAALPIVSGSAVSESEGKRFLNSIKIQMGDNDNIVARKLQAKQNFVLGLEAAVKGDSDMLQQLIDGSYDPGQSGSQPLPSPVEPSADAIAYLQANPNLAESFDKKYGPGASARVLGQ